MLAMFPNLTMATTNETKEITISNPVNIYLSSSEASKRGDEKYIYTADKYFIFNETDDAINITKVNGEPGGWVNKKDISDVTLPKEYEIIKNTPVYEIMSNESSILVTKELNAGTKLVLKSSPLNGFYEFQKDKFIPVGAVKQISNYEKMYLTEKVDFKDEEGNIIDSEDSGYKIYGVNISGKFYFVYNGKLTTVEYSKLTKNEPVLQKQVPYNDNYSYSLSSNSSLANRALSHVGKPYVFGASGPNSFDCSGLVYYLLKQQGTSIARTASAQASYGERVSWGNIQPGDLMFFSDGGGIYHVAIYVGNRQMVHASTPERGVVLDSIDSNWVRNSVSVIKRVK